MQSEQQHTNGQIHLKEETKMSGTRGEEEAKVVRQKEKKKKKPEQATGGC